MRMIQIGPQTFDLDRLVSLRRLAEAGGPPTVEAYFDGGPPLRFVGVERDLFLEAVEERLRPETVGARRGAAALGQE